MPHDRAAAQSWSAGPPQIFPSLLNCDFSVLADEIAVAERCGVKAVHWDVMDGHFVPNLSYGALLIKSCRGKSNLYFDAHLMIEQPEKYLDDFLDAGCDGITFHLEASPAPAPLLARIRSANKIAGLSLNPTTAVERLKPFLEHLDLINVMSVEPGFGGQKFLLEALDKLRWLQANGAGNLLLQVDGGVNRSTAASAVAAGAKLLVVGSAFYGAADRADALASLHKVIA